VGLTPRQVAIDTNVKLLLPKLHTLVFDTRDDAFSVGVVFRNAICPNLRYLGLIQRLCLGQAAIPRKLPTTLRVLDLTECHRAHLETLPRLPSSVETLILPLRFSAAVSTWMRAENSRTMSIRQIGLVRMMWDSSSNVSPYIADDLHVYANKDIFPQLRHIRVFRMEDREFSRSILSIWVASTKRNKILFDNHEGILVAELLARKRRQKISISSTMSLTGD
jgi:hypothetical protein